MEDRSPPDDAGPTADCNSVRVSLIHGSFFNLISIHPCITISMSAPKSKDAIEGGVNHSWEATGEHIWESAVREDEEGNIVVDSQDTLAEKVRKRRRLLERQDYSQRNRRVVRDMIRYLYIIVDASRWTRQKDSLFPGGATVIQAVTKLLTDFIQEYFDQNPVSHLGLVMAKEGEAVQLHSLSGNSRALKEAVQSVADMCGLEGPARGGEFSLQNSLEVAGRSLGHMPRHGSREIVIVTSALSTCDPGFILTDTLPKLQQASIRVSCIALSAELYICRKLTEETTGVMGVCIDHQHFRDWMMAQCTPPPTTKKLRESGCEMIRMGFPSRTSNNTVELVHAGRHKTILSRTGFICPQCQAKNSELPTDCAVCGLKLVLAPHLARSFHHLFPVPPFVEVEDNHSTDNRITSSTNIRTSLMLKTPLDEKILVRSEDNQVCCFACLRLLAEGDDLLRYQCPSCENLFCVDCDAFLHHSLHNCPGCLCQ